MIHQIIELPVQYRQYGIENNNFIPRLTTYILANNPETGSDRRRPLVIICPGGAYRYTSFREAEPVALKMNSLGFHACVLEYSCAPMDFPAAFLDLCEAVHYVRAHSGEWGVDISKIIVCGFSAGGHLAASLGVWWHTELPQKYLPYAADDIRPNALLLAYPVITSGEYCHEESIRNLLGQKHLTGEWRNFVSLENRVTKDVPPAFLWHTAADKSVPIQNSLLFVSALAQNDVPFEYHVFTKGVHGLSLANRQTAVRPEQVQKECAVWPGLFSAWAESVIGDN
jgi:acetyl esterase/lipase